MTAAATPASGAPGAPGAPDSAGSLDAALDQGRYQVRFDWGTAGLRRTRADVLVLVDVLEDVLVDVPAERRDLDRLAERATEGVVVRGGLVNATAVAERVLDLQLGRSARTSVALIAVGDEEDAGAGPGQRFCVEDLLGAGAVIDALAVRGIDHTSPEAAVACEAFRGLRGAVKHLLTASGTGQRLIDRGRRAEVLAAAALDSSREVPTLRG